MMPVPASVSSFLPLAGQVAVVTGGSGGIGGAICLELARAGADIIVHGLRRKESADAVAEQVRGIGRVTTVILADVAEAAARDSLVEEAWGWRGAVDIWINNAGADVLTGEAAQWNFAEKLEALWRVDVAGTIVLSRVIGSRMKTRGRGAILNIGWDQAEQGMAGDSGEMFAAVKGAVMAFTRSLAKSLAPEVRVNCLAPGWIRTAWGHGASDYWQKRAAEESLCGRWGTPEDVARAAAFLASPAADFINGQVVAVNGGFRYGGGVSGE